MLLVKGFLYVCLSYLVSFDTSFPEKKKKRKSSASNLYKPIQGYCFEWNRQMNLIPNRTKILNYQLYCLLDSAKYVGLNVTNCKISQTLAKTHSNIWAIIITNSE